MQVKKIPSNAPFFGLSEPICQIRKKYQQSMFGEKKMQTVSACSHPDEMLQTRERSWSGQIIAIEDAKDTAISTITIIRGKLEKMKASLH